MLSKWIKKLELQLNVARDPIAATLPRVLYALGIAASSIGLSVSVVLASSATEISIIPQTAHRDTVSRIAVSRDGNWLLSSDEQGGVMLWDLRSDQLVRSLRGHTDDVNSLAFLGDGERAISTAFSEDTPIVWDLVSGFPVRRFDNEAEWFLADSVTPVGHGETAVISSDARLFLANVLTGQILQEFSGVPSRVRDVEISGDGALTVAYSADGQLLVWSNVDGKPVQSYVVDNSEEGDSFIGGFAIDKYGRLAVVTIGKELVLVDLEVDRVWRFASNTELGDVTFLSDYSEFAYRSGKEVIIRNAESGEISRIISLDLSLPNQLNTHDTIVALPDSRGLAIAADGKVIVIRPESPTERVELTSEVTPMEQLILTPGERPTDLRLITGGRKQQYLTVWDAHSGIPQAMIPARHVVGLANTGFDAKLVVVTDELHGVPFRVFDLEAEVWLSDRYQSASYESWTYGSAVLAGLDTLGEDYVLIARSPYAPDAANFGVLEIWNIESGSLQKSTAIPFGAVTSIESLSDGTRWLMSHETGVISFWSIEDLENPTVIDTGEQTIIDLAVDDADGAVYGLSGDLIQIDLGQLTKTNDIFMEGAFPLILETTGQDGEVLIANASSQIRLWDIRAGADTRIFSGHLGSIANVAVHEERVYSVGVDGTLRFWDLTTSELLATAVTDGEGQWITITPEGYFVRSGPDSNLLAVVRGRQLLELQSFAYEMERANLVRDKIRGDPDGKVSAAAEALNLQDILDSGPSPAVEITRPTNGQSFESVIGSDLDKRLVPVEVVVTDRGGGIGRIEWRILPERQIHRREIIGPTSAGDVRKTAAMVPVDDFNTEIEVTAYNERGLRNSAARVSVTATKATVHELPSLYLVAIGIGKYADSTLDLGSPKWDVRAVSDALKQSEGVLYDKVIVRPLVNSEATKDRIGEVFASLSSQVLARDAFVFYVSGHGKAVSDDLYILPGDYHRAVSETSLDAVRRQGIGRNDLATWFAQIRARKRIEIYDVCNAAALATSTYKSLDDVIEMEYLARKMNMATGNIQMFASQSQEVAIDA